MTATNRRRYYRHPDYVPILYTGYDSKTYKNAIMRNSCLDGMYFESDVPLQPKFDLYITLQRPRAKSFDSQHYKAFRAKVQWCRQMIGGNIMRYGTGVQFTAKSHLAYGISIRNFEHHCDFCENRDIGGLVHQTETGLLLCTDCLRFIEALPNGIEESVERFLLGNVV